jgi:hypothetical protein
MTYDCTVAKPVTLAEYQKWLDGIGIYTRDSNWDNHKHDTVLKLFKILEVKIDMENGLILYIDTDNPMIGIGKPCHGYTTILDCLDMQILEYKMSKGLKL